MFQKEVATRNVTLTFSKYIQVFYVNTQLYMLLMQLYFAKSKIKLH